jgi:hypothetical protein
MGTAEKLEILIKQFLKTKTFAVLSPEMDNKTLNDALAAFEKSSDITLYNMIIKIAAVIIISVGILFFVFNKNTASPNLLLTAIAKIQNADTLIYDIQTGSQNTNWLLTKSGYIQISSNNGNIVIALDNMNGNVVLPDEKKSIKIEMPNINKNVHVPFLIINKIKSLTANNFVPLGKHIINGKISEGFCLTEITSTTNIWIDRDSQLPVQIEIQSADKPLMNMVATNFQINIKIEKPSLENYEKLPIRLNAESWMANEFYLNEFFASLAELNKDKNSFASVNNPSNLTGIAMRLQEKNSLANYNSEFVCP